MEQSTKPKLTDSEIKEIVKERYGKCAETGMGTASSCCAIEASKSSGFATDHGLYTQEDISLIPETALSLSRGCGNPTGFAALQPGEIVVDFGCGAGVDVIRAARKITPNGKVIGVDFASEMIEATTTWRGDNQNGNMTAEFSIRMPMKRSKDPRQARCSI